MHQLIVPEGPSAVHIWKLGVSNSVPNKGCYMND